MGVRTFMWWKVGLLSVIFGFELFLLLFLFLWA